MDDLAHRLGLDVSCPHLTEALTHPSYANEHPNEGGDNQRLEFLGDAVLGLIVGEMLMERFPHAREGELSLLRTKLVSADALAAWARDVSLGTSLRLGRGAATGRERDQKNVLADAAEAVLGAIYLDLGLESARRVGRSMVEAALDRLHVGRDAKSELQERVQASGEDAPRYRVVAAMGPDHDREFVVAVEVGGLTWAEGRGRSKKQAEQDAARVALLGWDERTATANGRLPEGATDRTELP